jgi:hypothetical protein
MNNIVITIVVSLATSFAFNLYYKKANPSVGQTTAKKQVSLTHDSTEEGLQGEIAASDLKIHEGEVKVLPKTSVETFYCSLAPNRFIAKFKDGTTSFWDNSTGSFEESIKREPDDIGSYELFQTYIKVTHNTTGKVGIFKIHEVEPNGRVISYKELDIVLSIMNCDF